MSVAGVELRDGASIAPSENRDTMSTSFFQVAGLIPPGVVSSTIEFGHDKIEIVRILHERSDPTRQFPE